MEEEEKEAVLNTKCPGKLDFNAPILSTRLPKGLTKLKISRGNSEENTCNRIPFSWEQIPGTPKTLDIIDKYTIDVPPTPKLPPGRWNYLLKDEEVNDHHCKYDDGCEADAEYEEGNDGISSYSIDIFSLGDSMDTAEAQQQQQAGGYHSPDFMIKRFLADARALAASSISDSSSSCSIRKPYPSSKSTRGLSFLFPWRIKPKPCGAKNIIQATSPKLAPQFCVGQILNRSPAKSPRTNAL